MVPGLIFSFDFLCIHCICAIQDVDQHLKMVCVLVHVDNAITTGWTYAYQELPLEESLIWFFGVVFVVLIQEDRHVGRPYLVGPSMVHSSYAGHDLSVRVDGHTIRVNAHTIQGLRPIRQVPQRG